jgi:hypothetical protein
MIWERFLEKWLRVYNEVKRLYASDTSQQGKIIITTSYGFDTEMHKRVVGRTFIMRLCKYTLSYSPILLALPWGVA